MEKYSMSGLMKNLLTEWSSLLHTNQWSCPFQRMW